MGSIPIGVTDSKIPENLAAYTAMFAGIFSFSAAAVALKFASTAFQDLRTLDTAKQIVARHSVSRLTARSAVPH